MNASRAVRLAALLWILLAFLVWNVIFDRTLVLAGRRYVYAASVATRNTGTYLRIDDWMQPAIARGVRTAILTSVAVGVLGLGAVAWAARRGRRTSDK